MLLLSSTAASYDIPTTRSSSILKPLLHGRTVEIERGKAAAAVDSAKQSVMWLDQAMKGRLDYQSPAGLVKPLAATASADMDAASIARAAKITVLSEALRRHEQSQSPAVAEAATVVAELEKLGANDIVAAYRQLLDARRRAAQEEIDAEQECDEEEEEEEEEEEQEQGDVDTTSENTTDVNAPRHEAAQQPCILAGVATQTNFTTGASTGTQQQTVAAEQHQHAQVGVATSTTYTTGASTGTELQHSDDDDVEAEAGEMRAREAEAGFYREEDGDNVGA